VPDLRTVWYVIVPGCKLITMAGERCTRTDALRDARVIWPDAEIQDDFSMPDTRLQVANNTSPSKPE